MGWPGMSRRRLGYYPVATKTSFPAPLYRKRIRNSSSSSKSICGRRHSLCCRRRIPKGSGLESRNPRKSLTTFPCNPVVRMSLGHLQKCPFCCCRTYNATSDSARNPSTFLRLIPPFSVLLCGCCAIAGKASQGAESEVPRLSRGSASGTVENPVD